MPPAVQRSNAKHYHSATVTEIDGVRGAAPAAGVDQLAGVADYALDWAVARIGAPAERPLPRVVAAERTHRGPTPPDVGARFRWLSIGEAVEVEDEDPARTPRIRPPGRPPG